MGHNPWSPRDSWRRVAFSSLFGPDKPAGKIVIEGKRRRDAEEARRRSQSGGQQSGSQQTGSAPAAAPQTIGRPAENQSAGRRTVRSRALGGRGEADARQGGSLGRTRQR